MEQMTLRAWPWNNVTLEELEEHYKPATLKLMLDWCDKGVHFDCDAPGPSHILLMLAGHDGVAWEMEESSDVLCGACAHEACKLYGMHRAERFRWEDNDEPYRYFQCDGCLRQWGLDASENCRAD